MKPKEPKGSVDSSRGDPVGSEKHPMDYVRPLSTQSLFLTVIAAALIALVGQNVMGTSRVANQI